MDTHGVQAGGVHRVGGPSNVEVTFSIDDNVIFGANVLEKHCAEAWQSGTIPLQTHRY